MAKTARNGWVAIGLMAVGLMGTTPTLLGAEPAAPPDIRLRVLIDDHAGVPANILEQARKDATRVFRQAHIEIVWLEHGDARLQDAAVLRSVVVLHFVASDMVGPAEATGEVLGRAAPGTRVAAVFYNRIEGVRVDGRVSRRPNKDTASLLGSVIAHEIGHLLLPPHAHCLSGIMQAGLDIRTAVQGGLFFSAGQADKIRTTLRTSLW